MPRIPENFQFSQSSLQDYMDCPRRFELRYLLKQEWPALQSEPVLELESHMEQGKQFHRMVQQHLIGIPEEQLSILSKGPALQQWWDNYLSANPLEGLPQKQYFEYRLTAPFGGYRIVAQYDLIAISPGERAVILDWKTSQKRTRSEFLKSRMQTRLYPFLLVLGGQELNQSNEILPDQIEMIYWFAGYPAEPEFIRYTQFKFEADRDFLFQTLREIANRGDEEFPKTMEVDRHCKYCRYRSLCKTGKDAGDWRQSESGELEEIESLVELDIDQISEIEI